MHLRIKCKTGLITWRKEETPDIASLAQTAVRRHDDDVMLLWLGSVHTFRELVGLLRNPLKTRAVLSHSTSQFFHHTVSLCDTSPEFRT